MKYIFILNEEAGKGKSIKLIPNIEKACKKRNIEYEIRYITKHLFSYIYILTSILNTITKLIYSHFALMSMLQKRFYITNFATFRLASVASEDTRAPEMRLQR